MDYRESMQRVIDYIEENLEQELKNEELASVAGYSSYHFLRIFYETTRMTPSVYVRRRRLSEIVRNMDRYDGAISDLAFRYGFNSKENFIRAFKAEFRVLPTEYRRKGCSFLLYDRISFTLDPLHIVPVMKHRDAVRLTVLESGEKRPMQFWNRYNCAGISEKLTGGRSVLDYGVCRWNAGKNRLDYFIGVESETVRREVPGTRELVLPAGLYAEFATPVTTHCNFVNLIQDVWAYILQDWLPKSGYERTGGYEFETYRENSRTYSENIYIPVKEKEKGA